MNEPARSESNQTPEPDEQSVYRQSVYRQPSVELISLNCEISAYAPDEGDVPLF